ncbi:MAG: AAA family ATPase, partial [Acidimicrobiales bacterium]
MTDQFAEVAETHVSTVFFAGDRAYKLLKPVKTGFLDFSTSALRLEAATLEIELNRRIAPDVYLGVSDVVEAGSVVDRFIVMKRMPAERRLSVLLNDPESESHVRRVARSIAQFHASLDPIRTQPSPASIDAVKKNWDDNVEAMAPFVGTVLDAEQSERIVSLYRRFLKSRDQLFAQRIDSGLVRDGHGDLTAEDIFCLDDGPRILDCLAFDDSLRISDVLLDVAFLAMDIERISGASTAVQFMESYTEFSNEHHPSSLLHHYVAYRAHVRAKVACLRFAQGDPESAELARRYLSLCLHHLELAAVKLVLIGGAPGTGKTTLANSLSGQLNWIVLNSDELRKDIAGRGHEDHEVAPFGEGIYSEEFNRLTYTTMLDQALYLLHQGESVVLDASWPSEDLRALARRTALSGGADLKEFECRLPADQCKTRISSRLLDPGRVDYSDATPEIVEKAIASREEWSTARALDASLDVSQLLTQIQADLDLTDLDLTDLDLT